MNRAWALCLAVLAAAPALAERRFALVIGDKTGGAGTRPLRYAERDATRIFNILTRLGGVRDEDARLLTGATAREVTAALDELGRKAQAAHEEQEGAVRRPAHRLPGAVGQREAEIAEHAAQLGEARIDAARHQELLGGAAAQLQGVAGRGAFHRGEQRLRDQRKLLDHQVFRKT